VPDADVASTSATFDWLAFVTVPSMRNVPSGATRTGIDWRSVW